MLRKKNGTLIVASLDTVKSYLKFASRDKISIKVVGVYNRETNESGYYQVTMMR